MQPSPTSYILWGYACYCFMPSSPALLHGYLYLLELHPSKLYTCFYACSTCFYCAKHDFCTHMSPTPSTPVHLIPTPYTYVYPGPGKRGRVNIYITHRSACIPMQLKQCGSYSMYSGVNRGGALGLGYCTSSLHLT